MQQVAGDRLACIPQRISGVPPNKPVECPTGLHRLQENGYRYTQTVAGNLRDCSDRVEIKPEGDAKSDHALVADGRCFDFSAVLHADCQGNHPARGKVDVGKTTWTVLWVNLISSR